MIFFWYGENEYAIAEQLKGLKAKYIEKTGSDADMQTLEMLDHDIRELIDVLSIVPMFVTSRLIVVRDLRSKKPDQKLCDQIVAGTPDSTNLVLVEPKPDKRSTYFKFFAAQKGAKEFKNLGHPQLLAWLQKQAQSAGLEISNSDSSYLLDRVGNDQWRLGNELRKLQNSSGKVDRKTIDELVIPSIEYSSFALVDCLVKKDLPRTLKLYKNLHTQGEADQMILGAIMYQYRVFLAITAGGAAPQAMGISPYAIQKSNQLAKTLSTADLKLAFGLLAKTDLAIKTGELSSVEALKRLFEQLCSQ